MKESDVLDELMASLVQKYDFEFRVEELFKAPGRNTGRSRIG